MHATVAKINVNGDNIDNFAVINQVWYSRSKIITFQPFQLANKTSVVLATERQDACHHHVQLPF